MDSRFREFAECYQTRPSWRGKQPYGSLAIRPLECPRYRVDSASFVLHSNALIHPNFTAVLSPQMTECEVFRHHTGNRLPINRNRFLKFCNGMTFDMRL